MARQVDTVASAGHLIDCAKIAAGIPRFMPECELSEKSAIEGRMSMADEFLDAADHLGEEMPNAAGDLYVDACIAASDVICCVRLGVHSNTGNHAEAAALLKRADSGSERQ